MSRSSRATELANTAPKTKVSQWVLRVTSHHRTSLPANAVHLKRREVFLSTWLVTVCVSVPDLLACPAHVAVPRGVNDTRAPCNPTVGPARPGSHSKVMQQSACPSSRGRAQLLYVVHAIWRIWHALWLSRIAACGFNGGLSSSSESRAPQPARQTAAGANASQPAAEPAAEPVCVENKVARASACRLEGLLSARSRLGLPFASASLGQPAG